MVEELCVVELKNNTPSVLKWMSFNVLAYGLKNIDITLLWIKYRHNTFIKREMLTCALETQVNESNIEIVY